MARPQVGIWFIGAKGGVATTAMVGLIALRKGFAGPTGLVSELPEFAACGLADWQSFVIGGHDIRAGRLYDEALRLHTESRAVDADLLARCKSELERIEKNLCPGTLFNVGPRIARLADADMRRRREAPSAAIERIAADLAAFQRRHRLEHVVVVNLASTEPPVDTTTLPPTWKALKKLLDRPTKCSLPASSLYAIAAIEAGCSYVNFTPSLGSAPEAICELAIERGTRHAGCDGKTGETLLKSTLAPMFARRNLQVMSWVGHNIFGNLDGQILDDPANKQSKVASKDRLLGSILGYAPQTLVSIEYIESLADWKTAWDHVHFRGFLGTPMTMQFTWQGCDSLLAAPLVLDLVRFTHRAWRQGEVGVLTFLSSFFKSPLSTSEHDFSRQFEMLTHWAASIANPARKPV